MLVERLQKFALGQDSPQGDKIEMSPAQVKAVQVLLDRVLPVLSAQDLMHHSDLAQDYSEEELITMAAQALGLTGEEVVMLIKRKTMPALPENPTLN